MTQANIQLIQDLRAGKVFRLTLKQIYQLLKDEALHTEQSTQRKFIYDTLTCNSAYGKITKAQALPYAVLRQDIQLPALTFWYNTDTDMLNVMDGKQRILSLTAFIEGRICSPLGDGGKALFFSFLKLEDQLKLANYTFTIDVKEGNSRDEERNFDAINSNGIALTPYECLRGKFHGKWIYGFEDYVNSCRLDNIDRIERGEQALQLLYGFFNIKDSKKPICDSESYKNLSSALALVRDNDFDPNITHFAEKLKLFSALKHFGSVELNNYTAMAIVMGVINHNYDVETVKKIYMNACSQPNDIKRWNLDTHKTFILAKLLDNLDLDPLRNFSESDKSALFEKSPKCAVSSCTVKSYKELEVDHVIPWSKGGRTTLANAQLLCRHHNAKKNNKYEDIDF